MSDVVCNLKFDVVENRGSHSCARATGDKRGDLNGHELLFRKWKVRLAIGQDGEGTTA